MIFRPASGSQLILSTIFICGFLLVLSAFLIWLGYMVRDRGPIQYVFFISGCFLLLLLAGSVAFRVRGYELSSNQLVVKIGFGQKVFPLQNLQDARLQEKPFAGCRRDFGVGGLWSVSGSFTSPQWGKFLAYASDTSRGVLLTWPDKRVLVTPADPNSFMQSLKQ